MCPLLQKRHRETRGKPHQPGGGRAGKRGEAAPSNFGTGARTHGAISTSHPIGFRAEHSLKLLHYFVHNLKKHSFFGLYTKEAEVGKSSRKPTKLGECLSSTSH